MKNTWIGRHHSEESKEKMRKSHTGKKQTKEHSEKISKSRKGKPVYWLKGKNISKEHREKIKLSWRKRSFDQKGLSNNNWKGGKPSCVHCGKVIGYNSKYCIDCFWGYEAKNIYGKKKNKVESVVEKYLEEKYKGEWKFVGDGQVWIVKRNPDFININGQKKIIEVYGDYWHKGETGEDRIAHYGKYGFATLILWEHEIKNESYKQILQNFMGGDQS